MPSYSNRRGRRCRFASSRGHGSEKIDPEKQQQRGEGRFPWDGSGDRIREGVSRTGLGTRWGRERSISKLCLGNWGHFVNPVRMGIGKILPDTVAFAQAMPGIRRPIVSAFGEDGLGDPGPFCFDFGSRNCRLPGPGEPVSGIANVSFHEVKKRMEPGSGGGMQILGDLMCFVPSVCLDQPECLDFRGGSCRW